MIYDKPRDINLKVIPSFGSHKSGYVKNKTKTTTTTILKSVVFFVVLFVGTALAFMIPLRPTYSASEKRNLKEFPEFSVDALISGSYFDDIGTWFSDTFPFREQLTRLNTTIKDFSGFDTIAIHGDVEVGDDIPDVPFEDNVTPQPSAPQVPNTQPPVTQPQLPLPQDEEAPDIKTQSMGAILVAGNSAYEYYNFSNTLAPAFINAVNNIKTASGGKSNVYAMVVPTSIDIQLNDVIRKDINTSDQKKALDYFNASFKDITAIDGIYEAERLHRSEYTYFRTDHHWTALGAYYAYEQFAYKKGIQPVALSEYEKVTFDGFLGTFYASSGQSEALGKTPDTVIAYEPINDVTCTVQESDGKAFDWKVISDVNDYDDSMKYLTFIGGDQAVVTLQNNDLEDGETCVVIKESYGNAFVPFLIPHYKTVYVVDPRHYKGTLSGFVSDKEIDDVLFIANISTTRNSIYIDALDKFVK